MGIIKRSDKNPILLPHKDHPWESEAVFNGCPMPVGKKIHLVYRAVSGLHYHSESGIQLRVSSIGHAISSDGVHFKDRRQLILPEEPWDRFGCEDPRVTRIGSKYFIFYTALSTYPPTPDGIRVALATTKDFKRIDKKNLVTPFNAKAMALFPEKIDGKFWGILSVNTDKPPVSIGLISFDSEEQILSAEYWNAWYASLSAHTISLQRTEDDHVEVGSPPLKTKYGWLLVYAHIQNYFSNHKVFGVEAVLLDLKNPFRIIGRTRFPVMVPEEEYELYGQVPNIIFPSGAYIKRGRLYLYYGSADTTCSVASCSLPKLIDSMIDSKKTRVQFLRNPNNPVLSALSDHAWEAKAVFNPAAWYDGKKVHVLYRAMSADNTSVFGYAAFDKKLKLIARNSDPVYMPRESFEEKKNPGGNSGCEDPRITKIGERLYMLYTAYDGVNVPRVAITSITVKDFTQGKWLWEKPVLISPPGFDDKDACLLPEKIGGRYMVFHRISDSIDLAFLQELKFTDSNWLEEHKWLRPRPGSWDSLKVGIATPPIKTLAGWILFYHGVSATHHTYRVGAVLLSLKDPEHIIARTAHHLFEPEVLYERQGQINNVVFPCGAVIIGEEVHLFYGGADSVVGIASMKVKALIALLRQPANRA